MRVRASFGLDLVHPVLVSNAVRSELSDVVLTIDRFDVVVKPVVQPKTEVIEHEGYGKETLSAKHIVTLLVEVVGCSLQSSIDRETHLRFQGAAAQASHRVLKHAREQSRDWKIDVGTAGLRVLGYWDTDGNALAPSWWRGFRIDASFDGGLTGEQWSQVNDRAAQGADTDLFEDWLFEAQAFRDTGEPVMAVVAAAVACEIGTVRLLHRKQAAMGISNTKLRRLEKHIKDAADELTASGYIESSTCQKIHRLFQIRNDWLHGNAVPVARSADVEQAIEAADDLQARLGR